MSETTPEATPVEDKVQAVVDAAREAVAAYLAETDADEQLAKLAAALDALDQTTA